MYLTSLPAPGLIDRGPEGYASFGRATNPSEGARLGVRHTGALTLPGRVSPSQDMLRTLRTPLTTGEAATLAFFDRTLDPHWEIFVQPHLNGCRPDFVLLNPNVGIAVYEVKDWDLQRPSFEWHRNANDERGLVGRLDGKSFRQRNPVAQLLEYKKEIYEIYCPRLKTRTGLAAITAGLLFPNAEQDDVERLFGSEIPSRYEVIVGRQAFERSDVHALLPAARFNSSRLMSPDLAADLRSWLIEPDHEHEQRQALALDTNQRALATTRTESGYRRIRGAAGSGKSAVLAARAANLAQEGKRVLVVTFNITILHYVRDLCARVGSGRPNDITWLNFHALCKRLVKTLGLDERYDALWRAHFADQPIRSEGEDEQVFSEIPVMILDAIASEGLAEFELYDAILVDEGQDYQPAWWQLLRRLHTPNGEMMLVADATQDVYGTAKLWTEDVMTGAGFSGRWNELPSSYRLPAALLPLAADFAHRFLPAANRLDPIRPQSELEVEPCQLRWVQVRGDNKTTTAICVDELLSLIREDTTGSHAMTDLNVLVDAIANGRRIVDALTQNNIKTATTFGQTGNTSEDRRKKLAFWKGRSTVKVATLHSFKGWEARFIVLHLTKAHRPEDFAVIYAGLTRLKRHPEGSFLTVVCSHSGFEEYGRTWPTFRSIPG